MQNLMKRLYVISDDSLDPIYAAVQSGHAVAQWLLEHPKQTWNNNYLIYVKSSVEIMEFLQETFNVSAFYEPDLNNQMTAIALEPNDINKGFLKKLKLLS